MTTFDLISEKLQPNEKWLKIGQKIGKNWENYKIVKNPLYPTKNCF